MPPFICGAKICRDVPICTEVNAPAIPEAERGHSFGQ